VIIVDYKLPTYQSISVDVWISVAIYQNLIDKKITDDACGLQYIHIEPIQTYQPHIFYAFKIVDAKKYVFAKLEHGI